jgi:PEGA domain-containing protein
MSRSKEVVMNTNMKRTAALAAVMLLAGAVAASAAPVRGFVGVRPGFVHRYGFYDPFWAPYWGGYYPYAPYVVSTSGDVKVEVTPKQAQVYVDGYYAGLVEQFDGAFHHLRTSPGGHTITVYLDGYRTVSQDIYARAGSTFKLRATMEKLAPGEVSAPVSGAADSGR